MALLLPVAANASTVTLTGTCTQSLASGPSSNITFSIINTGNGTATSMILTPLISGAYIRNSSAFIQTINPDTNYTRPFSISNASANGSYIINFIASYAQGSSQFSTIFPCVVYFGHPAGGPLAVITNFNNDRITANVSNYAGDPITANVVVLVPPSFGLPNPTSSITINGSKSVSLHFALKPPSYTDASFPLLTELSYFYKGVHYSALGQAIATFGPAGQSNSPNLITIGFIVLAAIFIILIVVSLFKARSRKFPGPKHEGN